MLATMKETYMLIHNVNDWLNFWLKITKIMNDVMT